jgi:hypothetical protein
VLNVLVSVLMEGILSSIAREEEAARRSVVMEVEHHHKFAVPLDSLLATLAHFTFPQHLNHQLEVVFALWYDTCLCLKDACATMKQECWEQECKRRWVMGTGRRGVAKTEITLIRSAI